MKIEEMESAVEAILFVSGEPVPLDKLAAAVNVDIETAGKIIRNLSDRLAGENRGIQIIEVNGSFQMCTNPIYFSYISALHKIPPKKILTQTLLETLSIIAYLQPITKVGIEKIRGVDATHAVNKLVEYELVCEAGRENSPGRPILFSTTDKFLAHFGFSNLSQLPRLNHDLESLRQQVENELKNT